jgi:hypothetical protein
LGFILAFLGIKKARKEDLAGKKVAPIQGTKGNRIAGELMPQSAFNFKIIMKPIKACGA